MTEAGSRRDYFLRMREQLFQNMADADLEFSRVRMQVEQMESDIRIGLPEPAEYADLKGRRLPQAEAQVLDLYRELLKLEDKIMTSS